MFYDFDLNIFKEVDVTTELFSTSKDYILHKTIKCDIQPSSQTLIKKTFGEVIESLFLIFADEKLNVGTIVGFDGCKYKINKKIPWFDYNIYSVIDV